jgi:exopolysaccharide biosynthesis WecB/TagA/CpsF family protein
MHIQANPAIRHQPHSWSIAPALPNIQLFGLPVGNATSVAALDWLEARIDAGEPTRVAFLNAHCVNLASADADYSKALATADAVLPDGSGIAVAARMCGSRITENLNGTDLIQALGRRLAASGRSLFLLGGQPGVAASAAASLARSCPGLRIAGSRHGFFEVSEETEIVREINASGADVLLVALGVPLQDTWLQRIAPQLTATLSFGVGGLFDFLSGRIPRAPAALRRLGLEWTYRLYQEPRRMWRRYVLGNPAFLARAVVQAVTPAAETRRSIDLAAKRAMDICCAALGLAALALPLVMVAAAIRATSPGPALLRQTRIGKDGKPFGLFKFRSMYIDADARRAALEADNQHGPDGVTFKLRLDPRVTRFGRLLRKSSMDELPQLWNVLIGDMSMVGPRPPLPQEVARYLPEQRRRLAAKPGLTCLWQISGRADLPFDRQVELDIEYLSNRTVLKDLFILCRTVPAVLTARGAY